MWDDSHVQEKSSICEYMDIFRRTMQRKSTFLAIDNVWDDHDSIRQALKFLEWPFHEDSLVMVTSRSQRALELLEIDRDASLEVPDLGLEDAVKLFLFHAAPRKECTKEEEKRNIKLCVDRCYFRKGDGQDRHYHPLALEALGFMVRRACIQKPSEWVKNLPRVKDFSYLSGGNPVFGILRCSFDILKPDEQSLFMDIVFYNPSIWGISDICPFDMKEWLCLLYKRDEAEMENRLDLLKRTGLLPDVDLESGKFSLHDLYREFAELEVTGKLDESGDVEKRKWAYEENGDMSELGSGHNLKRLAMRSKDGLLRNETESRLEKINWQKCSNLVVVKLVGCFRWTGGALNLKPLMCLRCFELCEVHGVERVEGLEGLKYLTYLRWVNALKPSWSKKVQTRMGRFPASLVILEIEDNEVLFGPDVLARCTKLCWLELYEIQADILDLSSCSSLQSVWLSNSNLRTLSGLTARTACGIKCLQVRCCRELVGIPGLEQLVGLDRLKFEYCVSMARLELDLQNLTKLQVLHIVGEQFSRLCLPPQLRELCLRPEMNCPREVAKVVEALKANGLKQLQVLDLSYNNPGMIGLENVGGWPALRCLNLSGCKNLTGLPDLSESTNLKELVLSCSEVELHDKDFCMLGGLPLLQPVPIGLNMRLDMARRKELYFFDIFDTLLPWEELKECEWEETDIGSPYRTTWRSEDYELSKSDSPTGRENASQV